MTRLEIGRNGLNREWQWVSLYGDGKMGIYNPTLVYVFIIILTHLEEIKLTHKLVILWR